MDALFIVRLIIFHLFVASGVRVNGSTHWVVTEDGKIQEQVYSVFHLRRPYDLVALMQQEARAILAENFMDQLDGQIQKMDSKRETDSDLQERFYRIDRHCVLAEKPLAEFNLFVSTVATCEEIDTRLQELCRNAIPMSSPMTIPNCSLMSQLEDVGESGDKFEHLVQLAMKELHNLSISPDFSLVGALPELEDFSAFGHSINKALEQNKSSWVLYNVAAYYQRLAGDARAAIECIRRALHFSPLDKKHIVLLNLANVLHQGQRSESASVIVEAALDMDPENALLKFTLGNIYAALAEYNKSVEAFDAVLRSNPNFEAAAKLRHAVLCHTKLEAALEAQFNHLQNTLSELMSFEIRLEFWQKQQLKMIQEQTSPDVRLSSEIDYAAWKIRLHLHDEVNKVQEHSRVTDSPSASSSPSSSQKNIINKKKDCSKLQKSGHPSPGCPSSNQPAVSNVKMQFDYSVREVEMQVAKLKFDLLAKQNEKLVNRLMNIIHVESIETTKAGQTITLFSTKKNLIQVSAEECEQLDSDGLHISMHIYFISDKNDFGIGKILSEISDDPDGPMLAPVCYGESTNGFDNLWNWVFSNIKLNDELVTSAKINMQMYINLCCGSITIEEFGRRMAALLEANDERAPKWMLYQMAASYWWTMGDLKNLGECLMQSKAISPEEHKQSSVMPFASLLSLNGLHLAAINFIKYSVDANIYNSDIILLLADLYVMTGELDKAIAEYYRVTSEEPENKEAWKRLRYTMCQSRKQLIEKSAPGIEQSQAASEESEEDDYFLDEDDMEGHCHNSGDKENCGGPKSPVISRLNNNREETQEDIASDIDEEELSSTTESDLDNSNEAEPLYKENYDQSTVEDDPLPDILLQVQEKQKFTAPFLCKHLSPTNFKHFTSTWLSVSAKGIVVSKLFDTKEPIKGPSLQPVCDPNHPTSALTLDHLAGMKHRSRLSYTAETGLREAFQTLGREGEGPEPVEMMGTRLALALQKNSTSWVLTTLAALYWRVTGNATEAIDCLRQALHYAPRNMKVRNPQMPRLEIPRRKFK